MRSSISGRGFLVDWLDHGGASTLGPRNPAFTGEGGLRNDASAFDATLFAGEVGEEAPRLDPALDIVFLFAHSLETGRGPKLGYLVWGMADCCGGRPWTNSIYPFLGSPAGVLDRDPSPGVGARLGGLGLVYDTSTALLGIPNHWSTDILCGYGVGTGGRGLTGPAS
eukprot:1189469-Prorocentrum_minimum.AAC.8